MYRKHNQKGKISTRALFKYKQYMYMVYNIHIYVYVQFGYAVGIRHAKALGNHEGVLVACSKGITNRNIGSLI